MGEKDSIHIALAFDQNFIAPFYVLLTSIFANNFDHKIVFHIIAEGLTEAEKTDIMLFVEKSNAAINFYSVDKEAVQQYTLSRDSPHVTSATFYRLYFPLLITVEMEYLLYLDTDIIVIGDLAGLFKIRIGQFPVGAVADSKILNSPNLGIHKDGEYFNAGVLLIHLKEWREQKISEKTFEFLRVSSGKIAFGDQDALNFVLANNWYKLDKGYNVTFYDIPRHLKKKNFEMYLRDKVIIHFTTQHKPWLLTSANRLRYLYQYYFQKSPHAAFNVYFDEKWRKKNRGKLLKRHLKEFLIDLGIPV